MARRRGETTARTLGEIVPVNLAKYVEHYMITVAPPLLVGGESMQNNDAVNVRGSSVKSTRGLGAVAGTPWDKPC